MAEGFVYVRNPYYPNLVTKFSLDPDVVDIIGFCTKNPRPLLKNIDVLNPYGQFWYVSITGLGREYEPFVPDKEEVIKDFIAISDKVGARAMGWRYTPIIIDEKHDVAHHIATFEYIAMRLEGYARLAVFGFLDLYPRLRKLHPDLHDASDEEKIILAKAFREIAKKHGLDLRLCSKEKWLAQYDIDVDGCMRISDYEASIGEKLDLKNPNPSRKNYCACYLSNDIGSYNSCGHGCLYCYANDDRVSTLKNISLHDDDSPLLIGNIGPNDKIREAKQVSLRKRQLLLI